MIICGKSNKSIYCTLLSKDAVTQKQIPENSINLPVNKNTNLHRQFNF